MKTLLVDCYREGGDRRMPLYRRLCEIHSEVHEVRIAQLNPDFDLTGCDAVVLSGSQWMLSSEEPPSSLMAFVRGLELPTLGICFGHQLLARAFGAEVRQGELIERDEVIEFTAAWSLFTGLGSRCVMLESHREFVTPESVRTIGWLIGARSASCPAEAIRHPKLPLFGVQFHPERSGLSGGLLLASFYSVVAGFPSEHKSVLA